MLGSTYDSDQSEEEKPKTEEKKEEGATAAAPKREASPQAKAPAAVPSKGKGKARKGLTDARLQDICKEIREAKSATVVVQVVRRLFDKEWDVRWGAEALQQIAVRSTARTRKEWGQDPGVKKLGERLKKLVAEEKLGLGRVGTDVVLIALDALRRMAYQEAEDQKEALERCLAGLVQDKWQHPVKSLARLFWLGAPIKLKTKDTEGDFTSSLPAQLRARTQELDGTDVGLLLAAMRREGMRDEALLEKVVRRLKTEGIHAGLSATDLVDMAEALCELGAHDEEALRPLGQEILRRRGELSPPESHRVHAAYDTMKLPLPQVWTKPGAVQKRDASELRTTQAFALQEGHEKKRRGNNEVERTSPPRVVRDYKMMSY